MKGKCSVSLYHIYLNPFFWWPPKFMIVLSPVSKEKQSFLLRQPQEWSFCDVPLD